MTPYRKILVGINYTDSSRHALKHAYRIAQATGAKLIAAHTVPIGTMNEFVDFYEIEEDAMVNAAKGSLEHFVAETLGEDHQVECRIEQGLPHYEIVALIVDLKIDLLVLGSDDYAADPGKSGQFAIRCLRFSTIPVLLVRNQGDTPFTNISACVDFSKSTEHVLEHTARMQFSKDHNIEILHAYCPPWKRPLRLLYQLEVISGDGQRTQFHEMMDGQLSTLQNSYPGNFDTVPTLKRLEADEPEHALLEHLKTSGCELAVIGRAGKGAKFLKANLLGSTAETVIRHVTCSVLIVPINT